MVHSTGRISKEVVSRRDTNIVNHKRIPLINSMVAILYTLIALLMVLFQREEYVNTTLFYSMVILGAVLFAALAQGSRTQIGFHVFYSLSFLLLFFILGFRKYTGIDDGSYIKIFYDVSQYGWLEKFKQSSIEPGYLLINSFVAMFTDQYIYMQLISSFIPLLLFYHGFFKYRQTISLPLAIFLLSTTLYFQMISVSLVRMFIAISLVFNAFYYITRREPIKYILLIFLASLFHYSSFFTIVFVYFAINKKGMKSKGKLFLGFMCAAIPIFFTVIAKFVVPILGGRYSLYGEVGSLAFRISSFDTVPLLILLIFFAKKITKQTDKDYFKLFILILATSSLLSFYSSMVSLGRLIFYVNIALFIAAPMISHSLRKNFEKVIFNGLIILYGFLYVYRSQFTLGPHIPYLFPYDNIFFSM